MGPDVLISFAAMFILFGVIMRGRTRVKALERQLINQKGRRSRSQQEAESTYNDNRLVKMVDYCRQLEGRVQNRSLLLECLIEDADQRIQILSEGTIDKNLPLGSKGFKEEFLHQVEMGLNDEALAKKWHKPELMMTLLRELWVYKAT
jgi:hypothetical protein